MFIKWCLTDKEISIMEMHPNVKTEEYSIECATVGNRSRITKIKNLFLQTAVAFTDVTLKSVKGYVDESVVEVWTEKVDHETLNILHFHVNDTSEEVTIDTVYMHEGENIEDFTEFGNDFAGRPLKYKILVKDCEVYKVLYCDEAL